MAVYVDPLFTAVAQGAQARRTGARHGHRWCHLFADTVEELHAMAGKVGMRRAWFQDKEGFPHYDLVPTRREAAVAAGAIELDSRAAVAKWRELRGDPLCVRHHGGWCALAPGATLDPSASSDPTACGQHVFLRLDSAHRRPTCPECLKVLPTKEKSRCSTR